MRLHPRNVALLVLVALLAVLNAALAPDADMSAPSPLAPGFDAARIERIAIAPPEGEALELARDADASGWTLPSRDGFPAFDYAVGELLARVASLTRAERVGEEPGSFDAHGVGAGGVRLSFRDASGATVLELVQSATVRGSAGGTNVRVAGEDDVFAAGGLPPTSAEPGAWLDTRLAAFDPTRVASAVISHQAGRILLELVRDGERWQLESDARKPAPRNLVERVLQVSSTLVFADLAAAAVSPETGFGNPPETMIELELADGERAALWIGVPDGKGAYYATNPAWPRPWCVSLPSRTAEVLFAAIDALAEAAR